MSKQEIQEILSNYRVIAVVGLSSDTSKPSYRVAQYMQVHGYRIIPINPFVQEVLGEKSFMSLLEMPVETQRDVELVDVFRRSDAVTPVVEQTIKLKQIHGRVQVVWMQLGVINEEAAEMARAAGLTVIMDRCLMVEHRRLFGDQSYLDES